MLLQVSRGCVLLQVSPVVACVDPHIGVTHSGCLRLTHVSDHTVVVCCYKCHSGCLRPDPHIGLDVQWLLACLDHVQWLCVLVRPDI